MNQTDSGDSRANFSPTRLAITVLVVLAIATVAYQMGKTSVTPPGQAENLKSFGLASPTQNKLDKRFTDGNDDLLADPPAAGGQLDPEKLNFSYLATDQDHYAPVWSAFVEHLAAETGKPVEYLVLESPNDQLRAIREGQLHVTGVNAGNVPLAVNACGFVPVISFGNEGAMQTYTMQIVVPSDSSLGSVDDVRGRTLALTSPNSNSGWKAPLLLLTDKFDLHPVRDYMVVASHSHQASVQGILDGDYEMASVASDEVALMKGRGEVEESQIKVLHESDPFPNNCFGHVYNLKPELAQQIRQAFLSFDWSGTTLQSELAAMGVSQFVEMSYKDDFGLIREIDEKVGREHVVE